MLSAGFIDSIIGGIADVAGGAIGGLFGDDEQPAGYSKEYGEQARKLRFGQNIGRRMAMGDPSVQAYFQSKLRTDPDSVSDFIDDFGGDFRVSGENYDVANLPGLQGFKPGGVQLIDPTPGGSNPMAGLGNQVAATNQARNDAAMGNEGEVLNRTLNRLSHPSQQQPRQSGYSFGDVSPKSVGGFSTPLKKRAVGTGNKYSMLNQERKTGMFA